MQGLIRLVCRAYRAYLEGLRASLGSITGVNGFGSFILYHGADRVLWGVIGFYVAS